MNNLMINAFRFPPGNRLRLRGGMLREVHAMGNKPGKKRAKNRVVRPILPVEFTDRDIETLRSHFADAEQKKLERLGDILSEWAKHEVPRWANFYPNKAVVQKQLKIIKRLIRQTEGLRDALENFEEFDGTSRLVLNLIEGHTGDDYDREKALQTRRLAEQRVFLRDVQTAAKAIESGFKAVKDQRRNLTAYLLLMDMAAIFKWLTGQAATRGSNDRPSPFDNFVGVLWSVIYREVQGMEAALKNWAKYATKFEERSAVVANINFRHPDWGLLNTNP